jgi:hypothetical protein
MAYISKRTGKEVDELLDRVERGGGGASISVDTELDTASNNAIAHSVVSSAIFGIGESISELQAKATPSGDPMHYAYEAVGAVWNGTNSDITMVGEYGDTYLHKAGCWLLNEVGDMTNGDMCTTITTPLQRSGTDWSLSLVYNNKIRTLLSLSEITSAVGWYGMVVRVNMAGFVNNNAKLEVVKLYTKPQYASDDGVYPQNMNGAFTNCLALRKVIGILDCRDISNTQYSVFPNCNSLEEIRIKNLKVSLDFHCSPLSVASAIYLLQNADATAQFTITFRADRQEIYEANPDFIDAKSAKPNITILYQ